MTPADAIAELELTIVQAMSEARAPLLARSDGGIYPWRISRLAVAAILANRETVLAALGGKPFDGFESRRAKYGIDVYRFPSTKGQASGVHD